MTQVHDDDLDNVFEFPENWDRDGHEAPAPAPATDQEPLFEQLRSAYLHRDDTNDWANDSDGRTSISAGSASETKIASGVRGDIADNTWAAPVRRRTVRCAFIYRSPPL